MSEPTLFNTEDEARAFAAAEPFKGWDHVFIYKLGDKFGSLWHHEDKYITSFLPDRAVVRWHGERKYAADYKSVYIEWEQRSGNYNQNDHDLLIDSLGKQKGEAFWSVINHEDDKDSQ